MALQIKNANELASESGVKMLVYGRAGVGKTLLTATLPEPILISVESGLLSLRQQNIVRVFGKDNSLITYNIPIVEINNLDEFDNILNWLKNSPESTVYKSIAIDSITEIAEMVFLRAKEQARNNWDAYSRLIDDMVEYFKLIRSFQHQHIFMSAKVAKIKDDDDGQTLFGPEMPGRKLGPKIPYYIDEVFYYGVGKNDDGTTYRYLRTQLDETHEAKDRSGALDPIEYPNLSAIIGKIEGFSHGQI